MRLPKKKRVRYCLAPTHRFACEINVIQHLSQAKARCTGNSSPTGRCGVHPSPPSNFGTERFRRSFFGLSSGNEDTAPRGYKEGRRPTDLRGGEEGKDSLEGGPAIGGTPRRMSGGGDVRIPMETHVLGR